MSDKKIIVVEENCRQYVNNVYTDYLLLPDRELKILIALKSFAWNQKENCYPSIATIGKISGKSMSQVREILRILEAKKLIRTEHHNGSQSTYYITNKKITPEKKLSTNDKKINKNTAQPHRKSGALPTGNPVPSPPEIRCRSNIKNITKENIKSICAKESFARSRFEEFWSVYPRKKDKKRAHTLWDKGKLDLKADTIISDIVKRLANDSTWKEERYIPNPSTYLDGERWNDEITLISIKRNQKFNPAQYTIDQLKKNPEAAKEAAKCF